MKTLLLIPLLSAALAADAQQYSIDWYKISGGGGTSTNSQFSVSGTIGQPDASGAVSGGNFSVTGGYWSLISVVQTLGAPTLTVTRSGNNVIISWSPSATGWTLQTNGNLGSTNWVNYSGPTSNNSVTNPATGGNLFFRLKQ
jgi:hypothetical protein